MAPISALSADHNQIEIVTNTKVPLMEKSISRERPGKPLSPLCDWDNDLGFEGGEDCHEPIALRVRGTIPPYVAGTLYRTGPGSYTVPTADGGLYKTTHWFDGFSQIHRFCIRPPNASSPSVSVHYNSRTNVDSLIDNIRLTGSLSGVSFGQRRDPCESYFRKIMSAFNPSQALRPEHQNVGVTVSVDLPGLPSSLSPIRSCPKTSTGPTIRHASAIPISLWAKTDAACMKQIDPSTLEPIGLASQTALHPDLRGVMSAAHARSDPVTGDVFNYNLDLGRRGTYRIFRTSAASGATEVLATIVSQAPCAYIHSMFLTENFVVLCVWSAHYVCGGIKILWKNNILDSLREFDSRHRAKWFVVDRRQGRGVVAKFESEAFFAFHTVNAWEKRSESAKEAGHHDTVDIVAEVVAYDDLSVLKRFYYDNLMSTGPGAAQYVGDKGDSARPCLRRYRLPQIHRTKASQSLHLTKLPDAELVWKIPQTASLELPTLNPSYLCRQHRYTYGVADRGLSSFIDGLGKFDSNTQTTIYWSERGHSPGEAIFVAKPDAVHEDDGVLLSVVLDGKNRHSYLLCLDARSMTELGRAEINGVVGFSFHGTFVGIGGSAPDV